MDDFSRRDVPLDLVQELNPIYSGAAMNNPD